MKTILLGMWVSSFGCDGVTTHVALARGGVERNPLLTQNPIVNDAILGTEGVAGAYMLNRYFKNHPRIATAIAMIGISTEVYATAHNIRTLHEQNRR